MIMKMITNAISKHGSFSSFYFHKLVIWEEWDIVCQIGLYYCINKINLK